LENTTDRLTGLLVVGLPLPQRTGLSMTTPPSPKPSPSSSQPRTASDVTSLVAAYVGKNWDSHYQAAWDKLGGPTGLGKGTSWNWPGALFQSFWLGYRKQYFFAALWFFGSIALGFVPGVGRLLWIAAFILFGMYGDRIILGAAWKTADAELKAHGAGSTATKNVAAQGGTNKIMLAGMIVFVPAMGIIAAIVIGSMGNFNVMKRGSYTSIMKADLSKLVDNETHYFADSMQFTADAARVLTPTTGVSSPVIAVTDHGFSATVTHEKSPGTICGIGVGIPNPVSPNAPDKEVVCR
jgi:uncharacterized membrane protein (GlpM family)